MNHANYYRAVEKISKIADGLDEIGEHQAAAYLRLSLANLSQYKDQVDAHIESLLNEAWRFTDDGVIEDWED